MKHTLPRAAPVVEYCAIPRQQTAFLRNLCRRHLQLAQQRRIFFAGLMQRREMLARAQQYVRGRLRVDVLERKNLFLVEHQLRRNFLRTNFAEQAIRVHQFPPEGGSSSSRSTMGENPSLARSCSAKSCAARSPDIFPTRTREK